MVKERARRQHEYDIVVRALIEALARHVGITIDYMRRDDGEATPHHVPDIMLRNAKSDRVVRVCGIETRCSLTRPRSERWVLFASIAPLTLIVPKGARRHAEELLWRTDARIVEYERRSDDEIVFEPPL